MEEGAETKVKTPVVGSGRFQWSTGGWFGAQVGSSLWMFVFAVMVFMRKGFSQEAMLVSLCFIFPNIVGTYTWLGRHRFRPFSALMFLVGVLWVASTVCILILCHHPEVFSSGTPLPSMNPVWMVHLIFLVIGGQFALIEFFGRRERKRMEESERTEA